MNKIIASPIYPRLGAKQLAANGDYDQLIKADTRIVGHNDIVQAVYIKTGHFQLREWLLDKTFRNTDNILASDMDRNNFNVRMMFILCDVLRELWFPHIRVPFNNFYAFDSRQKHVHTDIIPNSNSLTAIFTAGQDLTGGHLVLPEFRLALDMANCSLAMFKGNKLQHGIVPFTGRRVSLVMFHGKGNYI